MEAEVIVHILREALMTAFWLALPLLALGFVVGICINIIQIATSLQDTAFAAFPRLIAFLLGTVVLLPWMISRAASYTTALFQSLAHYGQ